MSSPVDPTATITQALTDPQNAAGDGQSVTSRPMDQIIQGLNYQAMLNTVTNRRRGVRYSRLLMPGCPDYTLPIPGNWGGFWWPS
jgi:hypothetical protein